MSGPTSPGRSAKLLGGDEKPASYDKLSKPVRYTAFSHDDATLTRALSAANDILKGRAKAIRFILPSHFFAYYDGGKHNDNQVLMDCVKYRANEMYEIDMEELVSQDKHLVRPAAVIAPSSRPPKSTTLL